MSGRILATAAAVALLAALAIYGAIALLAAIPAGLVVGEVRARTEP